jgi:ribosomal protein S18 acetylase RimI-like enzyme
LKPSDLAEAADANLLAHAGWVQGRTAGMTVVERSDLVLIDSGLPCDTFNFVCRARLQPAQARQRVEEAVAYFQGVARPFSWWVGPADRPDDLGDTLRAAGLERAETERAMAADLSRIRPPADPPAGLRIARVRSAPELADFARLSAANWDPPDAEVVRFYELAAADLLDPECPLWLYVGYVGRRPVATAELAVGGGVVGLYNIATALAHRRRGFGTAMTVAPLLQARARGYETAILQAAPEGVSLYERVGFRSFGDITEYKPPAPRAAA